MTIASIDNIDLSSQFIDNHKSIVLRCPFQNCRTRIIPYSNKLQFVEIKSAPNCVEISRYSSESDSTLASPELSTNSKEFYQVNDVWDFDNIGVSRPSKELLQREPIVAANDEHIEIERLLICSECEKGPLGFAGILKGSEKDHTNLQYFLGRDSVLYDY